MDFNDALKQLEKVNADPMEKYYWQECLEKGAKAID